MILFDDILIGPFRVLLLFAGVLLAHQIVTRQPVSNYNLDYLIKRLVIYSGLLLIVVFVLIQLNMYDVFSLMVVFALLLLATYFEVKNPLKLQEGFQTKRKSFLLHFFRFIERRISLKKWIKNNSNHFFPKKINLVLVIAITVATATFVSKYLFLDNDLYTLSELWIKNLELVKAFNSNEWFQRGVAIKGELALINFYSKITGISEEMAIHSFGLMEIFGIALVLYWFLQKTTKSKFIAPTIAGLFFAFFYRYLSVDISLILEHKPLYLSLFFMIPAMLFTTRPESLKNIQTSGFVILLVLYVATALISLFTILIIGSLFIISAFIFSINKNRKFVKTSLWAYLTALAIVLGGHFLLDVVTHNSFEEFLRINLILVNAYSHFPQLLLPVDQLMLVYTVFSWVLFAIVFMLWLKNKERWTASIVFLLFFNLFVLLKSFEIVWFDADLYHQAMTIFIPILIGIFFGLVNYFIKVTFPRKKHARGLSLVTLIVGLIAFAYVTNGFFQYNMGKTDVLRKDVLSAYDAFSKEHLPFTFAVVNQVYGHSMSTNAHIFITYDEFLATYEKRDSIYHKIRGNKQLMKDNPASVLPQIVFVFITKNANKIAKYDMAMPLETAKKVEDQLNVLKSKGRNISIYKKDEYLTIYQIINEQNSSNLNDLIFAL